MVDCSKDIMSVLDGSVRAITRGYRSDFEKLDDIYKKPLVSCGMAEILYGDGKVYVVFDDPDNLDVEDKKREGY